MKQFKYSFVLLIAFLMLSCGSSSKATVEIEKPLWLIARPHIEGYYLDIGSARKIGYLDQYTKEAKENELADILTEISVRISSTSVLNQMEDKRGISEIFQNTIKATSSDFLVGYEKVDEFETETHYFMYFKLSKATYAEMKEKRKLEALSEAKEFLMQASEFKKENDLSNAFSYFVKVIERLKEYLGESNVMEVSGSKTDVVELATQEIKKLLAEIQIQPYKNEIHCKLGKSIDSDDLRFYVFNSKKEELSNIPVIFEYTGGYLINKTKKTEHEGRVDHFIYQFKSDKDFEFFEARIDYERMLNEATKELIVRKLLEKNKVNSSKVFIYPILPKVFVLFSEKSSCPEKHGEVLSGLVYQQLNENKYTIVNRQEEADFIIHIDYKLFEPATSGRIGVDLSLVVDLTLYKEKSKVFSGSFDKTEMFMNDMCNSAKELLEKSKGEFKRKLVQPVMQIIQN